MTMLITSSFADAGASVSPEESLPQSGSEVAAESDRGGEGSVNNESGSSGEQTSADETTTVQPTSQEQTSEATKQTTTTAPKKFRTPRGKKNMSLTLMQHNGARFDLTSAAGQRLYAYDTLQGACANKGYGYFILYNRLNNYDKIVKVKMSDMSVVKVSAAMKLHHANDMTFNTRTNKIIVCDAEPASKTVSIVDPNSLTIKKRTKVTVSKKTKGMSKKIRKKYKGISAIAYNEKHNCYFAYMRGSHYILKLDTSFRAKKMIKQKKRKGYLYQGMDSKGDCIFVCRSFYKSKKDNIISVYNFKGKQIARYKTSKAGGREIETLLHDGNTFYAGFYSYYGSKADTKAARVQRKNYVYRLNNL